MPWASEGARDRVVAHGDRDHLHCSKGEQATRSTMQAKVMKACARRSTWCPGFSDFWESLG
jgi:hypothetical protein